MSKKYTFLLTALLTFSLLLAGCGGGNDNQDQPADNQAPGVEEENGMNDGDVQEQDDGTMGEDIQEDVESGLDDAQDEVDEMIGGDDDDTDQ